MNTLKAILRDENGQGMVEYGLIVALISVAIIASLTKMKGSLEGVFTKITGELGKAGGGK